HRGITWRPFVGGREPSARRNISPCPSHQARGPRMTSDGNATVFVIDDDALVRAAIQGMLKSVGLRAEAFATPQEFVDSKHPDGPSCLVLDVRLPGVNGL